MTFSLYYCVLLRIVNSAWGKVSLKKIVSATPAFVLISLSLFYILNQIINFIWEFIKPLGNIPNIISDLLGLKLALVLNSSNEEDNNEENSSNGDEFYDSEDSQPNNKNNYSESPPDRGSDEDPNDDDDVDDEDDAEENSDDDPKETLTEDLESVGLALDGDSESIQFIAREYSLFFNEGTPSLQSLQQVRDYLQNELDALEYRESNQHIPEEDSENKRKREDSEDEEEANKRYKSDNDDSNNNSGPSGPSSVGPSNSNNGPGPSSSDNGAGPSSSNNRTIEDYFYMFLYILSSFAEVIFTQLNNLL